MEQQEDEVLSITKGFIDYDDQKKLSFKFVNLKCNVDRWVFKIPSVKR